MGGLPPPTTNPFSQANSSRRSLLHPDIFGPTSPPPSRKRRKLEHNAEQKSLYDGFRYGHKGQVVPGRLKMEIVSCDGGEYDKHSTFGLYPIQNVLMNDKSVYCSERSHCNLLLKHIDETPFTLEKVVIRAPDRGFTAPVQEGLVFVAMSSEDIISATSSYKIEYGSESPRRSSPPTPGSDGNQLLSFQEAMNDPGVWESSRQGVEEQVEQLRLRSRRLQMENEMLEERAEQREQRALERNQQLRAEFQLQRQRLVEARAAWLMDNCEDAEDEAYISALSGVSAPTPPPFTISTETEDDEDDGEEETPSAAIMADRLRRESRWRTESDEDDDNYPPPRRAYGLDSWESNHAWRDPIRATRRQTASRIEAKTERGTLLRPQAKFFIEKHKNKVTIKFHPAISGKFVLLKLWSPTHGGNIDIESVQFYGFSGPRFFPSVQPC